MGEMPERPSGGMAGVDNMHERMGEEEALGSLAGKL